VKVKSEQTIKSQRGSRGIAVLCLQLGAIWRWGSAPPLGHFTPGNKPCTYGTGSWMGPGQVWTGFKNLASTGL